MASVRRKRTFAVVILLCLITLVLFYKSRERFTTKLNTVRTSESVEATRLDGKATVSTTESFPTKTYSVVPIGLDEDNEGKEEEEDEKDNEDKEEDRIFATNTTKNARGAYISKQIIKFTTPSLEKLRHSSIQRPIVVTKVESELNKGHNRPTVVTKVQSKLIEDHQQLTAATDDVPLACKVPILDPFDPSITMLINDVGTDLRKRCRSMHPRTPAFNIVDNKLFLRPGINESKISVKSTRIQEIQRDGDFTLTYVAAKNPFRGKESVRISKKIGDKDFFRLYYDIDGKRISDLYAMIAPKVNILEKQMKLARAFADQGIPLNVLIIGFDSISRANFVRKMGGVVSFLKSRMNTYFMEGMSIVGDATTPILTAMLTGKYETELPEGRRSFGGKPIDNWPWIMKEYEKRGYMTLFAEDDPIVGAFNLRLHGFNDSPVHHYMRPFWLSLEREHERDEPGLCSKSESMTNLTLKYLQNFFDAYPKARKFAFSFSSYLAHAHPNHLSYAENDLLWFLRTFVDKGYHKDTMVVIMGDHGSRNSEYRGKMQGKLEERLPWFSISLPTSFHRRYPDLATNLRHNQAIISSSFDVHATLRHILTYPKVPSGERTQSLFTKLPRHRTCSDAGIFEHWCPCFKWSAVDVASEQIQKVALATVDHINNELSKFPVLETSCYRLTLDSVQDAVLLQVNTKVQDFDSTDQDGDRRVRFGGRTRDLLRYQVIFTTKQNNAKYEATVSVTRDGHVKVNPEISRINRYNDQPKCIAKQYPHARKFCYCKS